jgi:hypothetical protein
MIIFDTNALYGLQRNTPNYDLLMAFKRSGAHSMGIPWMVREELVAQQVIVYMTAYSSAETAIGTLNRKMPWSTARGRLPRRDLERAKQYWRGQYEEVLTTIETSGDSAREALAREAFCQKPAKTDRARKSGARDVAIWLSLIDYLRENPEEDVYFVSNNYRDFGNGSEYPDPMSGDLADMKDRLFVLASFEDFISQFTEEITVDIERVKTILTELVGDSLTPVESAAKASMKHGRFEGTRVEDGSFETIQWQNWILPPCAVIRDVSDASGHKIGDDEWYTATVDWILVGLVQPVNFQIGDISSLTQAACEWRTRVLFSTGQNHRLTIVEFGRPKALDPSNRADLQPLIDKATAAYNEQSSAAFGAFAAVLAEVGRRLRPAVSLGDTLPG